MAFFSLTGRLGVTDCLLSISSIASCLLFLICLYVISSFLASCRLKCLAGAGVRALPDGRGAAAGGCFTSSKNCSSYVIKVRSLDRLRACLVRESPVSECCRAGDFGLWAFFFMFFRFFLICPLLGDIFKAGVGQAEYNCRNTPVGRMKLLWPSI